MGGESSSLYANGLLPGQSSIFVGAGTTQSAVTYPSETIEAWSKYTATAIPLVSITGGNGDGAGAGGSGGPKKNGARGFDAGVGGLIGLLFGVVYVWML